MASPFIAHDPRIQGGQACLGHTRMTVEAVIYHWWYGQETLASMIARGWPVESWGDLLVCCWWAGRHGTRPWRRRFGKWAKKWHDTLWDGDWATVALPPRQSGQEEAGI